MVRDAHHDAGRAPVLIGAALRTGDAHHISPLSSPHRQIERESCALTDTIAVRSQRLPVANSQSFKPVLKIFQVLHVGADCYDGRMRDLALDSLDQYHARGNAIACAWQGFRGPPL